MVRGIGIELDILGIQCNVFIKVLQQYLFLCCYVWLQNLCSRASHLRERWKLSSCLLVNYLKSYICKYVRGCQFIDDHHHHISDQRADNYHYEVNRTNDISL